MTDVQRARVIELSKLGFSAKTIAYLMRPNITAAAAQQVVDEELKKRAKDGAGPVNSGKLPKGSTGRTRKRPGNS